MESDQPRKKRKNVSKNKNHRNKRIKIDKSIKTIKTKEFVDNNISNFPLEILQCICKHLNFKDFINLSKTCKYIKYKLSSLHVPNLKVKRKKPFTTTEWIDIWKRIKNKLSSLDISSAIITNNTKIMYTWEHIYFSLQYTVGIMNESHTNSVKQNFNKRIDSCKHKFYYLPWNTPIIANNIKSLTIEYSKPGVIHPMQFGFFKNLKRLTLTGASSQTLPLGEYLIVFWVFLMDKIFSKSAFGIFIRNP